MLAAGHWKALRGSRRSWCWLQGTGRPSGEAGGAGAGCRAREGPQGKQEELVLAAGHWEALRGSMRSWCWLQGTGRPSGEAGGAGAGCRALEGPQGRQEAQLDQRKLRRLIFHVLTIVGLRWRTNNGVIKMKCGRLQGVFLPSLKSQTYIHNNKAIRGSGWRGESPSVA